jgi:N-acetylglutamate synthase-like GNAT family acetyltransferase
MENSKQYEQEWYLIYDMYKKGMLENPLLNFWQNDKTFTQTDFFPFGYICYTLPDESNDVPYIRILYILNEYRNKKIGEKLILSFLNQCKSKGINSVKVEPTFESLSFWKRLGFVEIKNDKFNQYILNLCNL